MSGVVADRAEAGDLELCPAATLPFPGPSHGPPPGTETPGLAKGPSVAELPETPGAGVGRGRVLHGPLVVVKLRGRAGQPGSQVSPSIKHSLQSLLEDAALCFYGGLWPHVIISTLPMWKRQIRKRQDSK